MPVQRAQAFNSQARPSFGGLYLMTVLGVLTAIAFGMWQGQLEKVAQADEWQSFAKAHGCKVVGQKIPTGLSFTSQTGWGCDDGVTYWRDSEK